MDLIVVASTSEEMTLPNMLTRWFDDFDVYRFRRQGPLSQRNTIEDWALLFNVPDCVTYVSPKRAIACWFNP